jgi:hypothetical protein
VKITCQSCDEMEVSEWCLAEWIENSVNTTISLALIDQKAIRLYEAVLKMAF